MENASMFEDVVLLVRLDSEDAAMHPEYVQTLTGEAKRRGLLVSDPISPNSPCGWLEFTLSSLSTEKLRAILALVTRTGYTSGMDLQNAVMKELDERKPSKAKSSDRVSFSAEKWAVIVSVDQGVALCGMNDSLKPVPIQNLEPSPAHGRGYWVVNPKV